MFYTNKMTNLGFKRFGVKFSLEILPLNLFLNIFVPVSNSYFNLFFFVLDQSPMKIPFNYLIFPFYLYLENLFE